MFIFETPEAAAFWFNTYSWLLFLGAFAVALGTYGTIISGSAKERFADERIIANEAETKRAIADSNAAKEGTARANERAADLEKQAADARLEAEKIKDVVAWRSIPPNIASSLSSALSAKPGSVNLRYTDGDPEALFLAIQIGNLMTAAHWNVAPGALKLGNSLTFGFTLPDTGTEAADALRAAFTAANIPFSTQLPQSNMTSGSMIHTIPGAPILMIGSRQPPQFP